MANKTLVDFIPKFDSTEKFFKIKDTDLFQMNNKVSTLLNLLSFNEGMNGIFPFMGEYIKLQNIQYSEDVPSLMDMIQSSLAEYLGFAISMTYEQDPKDEYQYNINIEVQDLPGKISFNVLKKGSFVKLINPKYVSS